MAQTSPTIPPPTMATSKSFWFRDILRDVGDVESQRNTTMVLILEGSGHEQPIITIGARRRDTAGNVMSRKVHASGGHFPALTNPEALLQDIRDHLGNEPSSEP